MKKISLALAMSSAAIYSASASATLLEEIIVTAQKRSQSQQDVPISIQAFDGKTLKKLGITNTDDLQMTTPGLQIAQGGPANIVFIRGLGNQDATGGQEGSVGTYVDGVWYGSVTGSALSFNNIERIEVLKGPQGTLFGRNTTGGVINIITKDPSEEASASIGLSYGNYDRVGFNFYGNRALSHNLAADLAIYGSDQGEGYGTNIINGDDVNQKEDEFFVRTKWKYTGDSFNITLAYSYEEYSDNMGISRNTAPGSFDLLGQPQLSDPWDIAYDGLGPWADFENYTASIRIEKEFSNFDFLSITAHKDDDMVFSIDNDNMPLPYLTSVIAFGNQTTTQEFQFTSNDPESKITWIGGLFLMDQSASGSYYLTGLALTPAGLNDRFFGGTINSTSIAAFGEVTLKKSEKSELTAGLRYTQDEREIEGFQQAFLLPGTPFWAGNFNGIATPKVSTPKQDESFSEPTWRLVYSYQASDDIMLYASYNRGFRSGNYNTVSPSDPAFEPEVLDAYEIGIKSDLLDGSLRINAAAYFYKVDDLQFQILQGTVATTVNAASAEINGFELDVTWAASDALTIDAGTAYMNGEYDNFPSALAIQQNPNGIGNQATAATIDATGNQVAGAPEWIHTLGATYLIPTEHGDYDIVVRATYNGGFPWESDGRLEQEPYTLISASAGWESADQKWAIRLTGKNLGNEDYSLTTRSQQGFSDFYAPAAPRTYDLSINFNF